LLKTALGTHIRKECPTAFFPEDGDRIIHSKAFRRLEYKTQVFAYYGDHYRTRLTHTLEVGQIARSMAQYLGANEDLTYAVALAHDLGHTPFGHAGEHSLSELMADKGGFEHNSQSLRVVDVLEARYPDFPGLNLTYETRAGIIRHSTVYDQAPEHVISEFMTEPQPTLEAQIVNYADEIAYNCHDIEDGLRSGFFDESDLEDLDLWNEVTRIIRERHPTLDRDTFLYQCIRVLIDTFIRDLVQGTEERLSQGNYGSPKEITQSDGPVVGFSPHATMETAQSVSSLEFLYAPQDLANAVQIKFTRDLFRESRPPQLPPSVHKKILKWTAGTR
jgi:dGTPase